MSLRNGLLVLALAASCFASATELVVNGDFETPTPDNTWNYSNVDGAYKYGSYTGWTSSGASGVWQPSAAMFTSMPSGLQAGWASDGGTGGDLTQNLGYALQLGDTVTFKVSIGDRANLASQYGLTTYGLAELYADNSLIMSASVNAPGTTGAWYNFTLAGSAGQFDAMVGKTLNVRLSSLARQQGSFDNVSVDVESVPEPATMSLLGLAVVPLLRRRFAK